MPFIIPDIKGVRFMFLKVAEKYGDKLIAEYQTDGLRMHTEYLSGRNFPEVPVPINWEAWERFVAWVDLQRKEEALERTKKP
jgi:hypothetical protein